MNKKRNAVMIADTRPALIGNILIQINETNKGLFDEAIIYYETISKKDMKIMQSVMPCRFIHFDYELPDKIKGLAAFEKFSALMLSRYYMFDLLNEYETITWIDTDVLICGKLDSIIEKAKINGMSANFEDKKNKSYKYVDFVRTSFKIPLHDYNMNKYNMSSGLITVADNLKDKEKMTKWCFDKTIDYAAYLLLPDQGVLNLLIQEFNIDVVSVGERGAYCFYPSYKRDARKAKIIHAWGSRKFWKSWYLFNEYPKWNEYYQKWLSLGGSDYFGEITPEVSIVIPMYKSNTEYFNLLLEDLLVNQVQAHGFQYDDFELILVVDGDENELLWKLIEKYDDPRVKVILNKTRQGIAKSLNMGIKAAKGKYIARIDDDDRVSPNRLYKQVEYLNDNKEIQLVTSDFAYFGDMNEERMSFEKEMAHAWSIFTCPFNHPTIMFKKSFFVENDLLYDENRKYVEDWELWLRAFEKGLVVGSIPEILYYHRWHNGSAGQNQNTINLMRELVEKNFEKLDIKLLPDDLSIIAPFNGKTCDKDYNRIAYIFDQALKNNKEMNLYDQKSLKKVFDYRLFEAKNGYLKDIVIKKDKIVPNNKQKVYYSIKQKMLRPIYKPIKRILYNIMSESVRDNLENSKIHKSKEYEMYTELNEKIEELSNAINNNFNDINKQLEILKKHLKK
ncbi:MAG: glycosyltransferase [Mollicutes bacterium]|nr:glycosyltransferase [Mollicutes bacterium]